MLIKDVVLNDVSITVTCLYSENACIYSCQSTTDLREEELRRVLAGTGLMACSTVPRNSESKAYQNFTPSNYGGMMNA